MTSIYVASRLRHVIKVRWRRYFIIIFVDESNTNWKPLTSWTFQRLQISWGQNSGCFDFHCAANRILSLYLFFPQKCCISVGSAFGGSAVRIRVSGVYTVTAHWSLCSSLLIWHFHPLPLLCLIRPIRSDHLTPETNHTIRVNTQCWAATCHYTPKNKRHLMP